MFSRVIFEKSGDVIVVQIVDGRRVSVCTSHLVDFPGLITRGVRGIGQVAEFPATRTEVRLTRASGSETVRQGRVKP